MMLNRTIPPPKELNETKIANLSDAEFKTLVIRMLKELIEYSNIKKEMKVTLNEIKKNLQRTNSEGKKAAVQINDLEHKKEINIRPKQNEETIFFLKKGEFKKTLGHFQMCQHLNYRDARRRRGRVRN